MDRDWRPKNLEYNREAREQLARAGRRFLAWQIVIMFYEVVIALDGYAEMSGAGTPKSHAERQAVVEALIPHLADTYDDLYGMSVTARYYDGYAMPEHALDTAAQCHRILMRDIPVRGA